MVAAVPGQRLALALVVGHPRDELPVLKSLPMTRGIRLAALRGLRVRRRRVVRRSLLHRRVEPDLVVVHSRERRLPRPRRRRGFFRAARPLKLVVVEERLVLIITELLVLDS